MNKNHRNWTLPVTGTLLLATAVSAEQDLKTYLDSTNRVTLSLRFGLNIKGRFKGVGSSFNSGVPFANGRKTPGGDAYNYDNGYVLTDISGNFGGQTWYWGYDSTSQVNPEAHTISFDRTTASGLPSENSGDNSPYVGVELTYNRELGHSDSKRWGWGIEAAVNYMPISFSSGGVYNALLSRVTDTYAYTPGTTPPGYTAPGELPYQGSFGGPGFVLNVPPVGSGTATVPGATFIAQQHFDGNLWGFRLGPYLEYLPSEKWTLHLSGGLAVGLLDANADWKETLTLPGGAGSTTVSGSGHDTDLLWGYYVGLVGEYHFNERWSVEAGAQYQDLGTYRHNFGGRMAELDLSDSIFIHAGISYSF